jgi:hypothetical protein
LGCALTGKGWRSCRDAACLLRSLADGLMEGSSGMLLALSGVMRGAGVAYL